MFEPSGLKSALLILDLSQGSRSGMIASRYAAVEAPRAASEVELAATTGSAPEGQGPPTGQTRSATRPIRSPRRTGPNSRESLEFSLWSPMTKTWSPGTLTGPK